MWQPIKSGLSVAARHLVGALTDWVTCYQKAGELCQTRGYTVMHKSGEAGFAATVHQYGGSASSTATRALMTAW